MIGHLYKHEILICLQISLLIFTSLFSLPLSSFFTSPPYHNLSVFLLLLSGSFLPSLPFLHRRFPVSDIPTDSDEVLADWLIKLYQEKVICLFDSMKQDKCAIGG